MAWLGNFFGGGRPPVRWGVTLPGHRPAADRFELRAWVAADRPLRAIRPAAGAFLAWEFQAFPGPRPAEAGDAAWFSGLAARVPAALLTGGDLRCVAEWDGGSAELAWSFPDAVPPERKRRKLERIRAILQPGIEPRATRDFLNFLPPDQPVVEPDLTSGYNYPDNVNALVARHADGLILDCGAGHRPDYLDNVVNLEIAPYPSTDVLADATRLPFRDNVFDGVVTLAVLEHVRQPWLVARELVRVLKPGGTLIADVPLLQPVHAYPSHFFNMTSEGLQSLFADTCAIESTDVPHYGRPAYTLAWFLQRYAAGLPADVRERFLELKVRDVAAPITAQLGRDYIEQLPKSFDFELASMTSITARKR